MLFHDTVINAYDFEIVAQCTVGGVLYNNLILLLSAGFPKVTWE